MRVFFCEAFDDGTVGGSHACMYSLVRHMDRSVFDFTIGLCSKNIYVAKYGELGVPVQQLPERQPVRGGMGFLRRARNWYRLEFKLQRWMERLIRQQRFDLVLVNNSIFVSLPYVAACRRQGVPVIVYERGIGRLWRRHARASAELSAGIPISRAVADHIRTRGYRAPVVQIIYDGIDPQTFEVDRDPAVVKGSIGIPAGARTIGIVGNLRPWKGQRYFVEAAVELARRHEDLHALIVGGCSEEDREFEAALRRTVSDAGLEGRIRFLGYRRDVKDLLSILNVFVHASVKPEPFGMVILEAMAARCPVVATAIGGPLEILDHQDSGTLVPPEDSAAIVAACDRYLTDPGWSAGIVNRAYRRLLDRFHISRTVDETASLFERVCGKSAGRLSA